MARVRSPNYPHFSLAEAVRRVGPVFENEHQHPMPKEVLVTRLGYGGVNGSSLSAISAMLKYGLVEQQGDSYRVTDRALTILHPHNDAEKAQALEAAALSPALFSELVEHFKGALPSDDNLRAYLVRRGFAKSALTSVIQAFRETMTFVKSDSPIEQNAASKQEAPVVRGPEKSGGSTQPPAKTNIFRVEVSANRVDVTASLLDSRSVDKLIKILEANKAMLPEESEPEEAKEVAPRN